MNKKLFTWLAVGSAGLAFIFALIGACLFAGSGAGAILAMCILAMLFALGAVVLMLLVILYKPKQPTTTQTTQTPTPIVVK